MNLILFLDTLERNRICLYFLQSDMFIQCEPSVKPVAGPTLAIHKHHATSKIGRDVELDIL